jgi:hypothetical protein
MNLVEVWFSLIERQAIHRGTFGSVRDLNAKIRAYIDGWNNHCHPFVWTKTADQILAKANRQKTSMAGHQDDRRESREYVEFTASPRRAPPRAFLRSIRWADQKAIPLA